MATISKARIRTTFLENLDVLCAAVIVVILLLIPLPYVSYDRSDSSEYWEWIGDRTDPDMEWHAALSCNSTVWWYDRNVTLRVHLWTSFKYGEAGQSEVNLTQAYVRLVTPIGYVALVNDTMETPLLNLTNLQESIVRFDLRLNYTVSLAGYESISESIGTKVKADLQYAFILETRTTEHGTDHTLLSNYLDSGVDGWTPSSFPITIDDANLRVSSILSVWAFALIPGGIYLVGRQAGKLQGFKKTEQLFYWLGATGLGLFLVVGMSLTLGPIFEFLIPDAYPWFSILVMFCAGIPVMLSVAGYFGLNVNSITVLDQTSRCREVMSITNAPYRTSEQMSEYWLTWIPQEHEEHLFRLAMSKYAFYFYALLSLVMYLAGGLLLPGTPTRIMGAVLIGIVFVLVLRSSLANSLIQQAYLKWRSSWLSFWDLMLNLTTAPEEVYSRLDPLNHLHAAEPEESNSFELLMKELQPTRTRLSKMYRNQDALRTASLVWYIQKLIVPKLEAYQDQNLKDSLLRVAQVCDSMKTPWNHPKGSEYLLRAAAFLCYALELATWAPDLVIDLVYFILERDGRESLKDPVVISRISLYNRETNESDIKLNVGAIKTFRNLQIMWSILSALVGYPLSVFLPLFV